MFKMYYFFFLSFVIWNVYKIHWDWERDNLEVIMIHLPFGILFRKTAEECMVLK